MKGRGTNKCIDSMGHYAFSRLTLIADDSGQQEESKICLRIREVQERGKTLALEIQLSKKEA